MKTKMDSNKNVGSTKAKWFVERNLQAAELSTATSYMIIVCIIIYKGADTYCKYLC